MTDEAPLLRTPLHATHLRLGARMMPFSGWDMPVQYAGILAEHAAVRSRAGLFDISHMGRVYVHGPEALAYLQNVTVNDVAALDEHEAQYSLLCREDGTTLDDILVYRLPAHFLVVVNAGNREKIISWLAEHKGTRNVEVSDRTTETCMAAVQGPKAVEMCHDLTAVDPAQLAYYHAAPSTYQGKPCVISRTGYTGEDGVEIIVAAAQGAGLFDELAARGAKPCGLGARDACRLEAGLRLYGNDMDETTNPFDAGLGWTVKLGKGRFLGSGALATIKAAGARRRMVGLTTTDRPIPRHDSAVLRAGEAIGRVTSGTWSFYLNRGVAMASLEAGGGGPGDKVEVDVRGKPGSAEIVALPIYRGSVKSPTASKN